MGNRFSLVPGSIPRSGVPYWEPFIDGRSLRQLLDLGWGPVGGEFATVLTHSWSVGVSEDVWVLLGERPSELPNGRALIYVCSECGDLQCGAVSMVLERTETQVTWRDFGWEVGQAEADAANDQSDDDNSDERGFDAGPFVFDVVQYDAELHRFIESFDSDRRPLGPSAGHLVYRPPGEPLGRKMPRRRWPWR
jgi:hypothetical protein